MSRQVQWWFVFSLWPDTWTLLPASQSAAPPVAHFHRQLNLIRVANTQLITLNLISCIMHRKLVKPLLGFILHDKALNYATALCFLYSLISMQCRRYGIHFVILAMIFEINFANQMFSSFLFWLEFVFKLAQFISEHVFLFCY